MTRGGGVEPNPRHLSRACVPGEGNACGKEKGNTGGTSHEGE